MDLTHDAKYGAPRLLHLRQRAISRNDLRPALGARRCKRLALVTKPGACPGAGGCLFRRLSRAPRGKAGQNRRWGRFF